MPGVGDPPASRADGLAPDALAEAAQLAESKNAAALLVVQKGRVVLERHWKGHRPATGPTRRRWPRPSRPSWSASRSAEGRSRSIDEPAAKWIPAWRDDARSKITLRHLLQMHAA